MRLYSPIIFTPAENINVRDVISTQEEPDRPLYVKSKGTDNGYRITFECITVETDYDVEIVVQPHTPLMIWGSFVVAEGSILVGKVDVNGGVNA